MRRKALAAALSARCAAERVKVIDRLEFARPRTKDAIALLSRLSCPPKTLVVIAPEEYTVPVARSFTNIPGVDCVRTDALTVYEVLGHEGLLLTAQAVRALEERLSDG